MPDRRLRRFHDWEARLQAFFEVRAARPFAWGGHDCALFLCDAVLAATGLDLAQPHFRFSTGRARYGSWAGACKRIAALTERGLEGVAEEIAAAHDLVEVHPGKAQRGDAVLLAVPEEDGFGEHALGVVALNGREVFKAVAPVGISASPLFHPTALRAWRIG